MSRVLNLNNTENIIADSIFLIQGDDLININDLFLTKDEGSNIVGIPPETLDTLQEIANAIGNDSDFINTINTQLNLKRNIADSYDKTYIDNLISNYYTKSAINSSLALKLDASVINLYYDKTYVDNLISGYYTKTEANTLLNLKANSSDVYTTTQTDNLLALKANQSTTYTKSEVDTSLNLKANQATTYTKLEVDTSLNLKANQATTYTKSEVDTALLTKLDLTTYNTEKVLKADIANVYYKSVLYTKTEVDTLLGSKFNSSDISNYYTKTEINTTFGLYYNKTYIDTLISNYYNKTYIDTTVSDISANINLKLNASAIDNYYTKAQVDTQFSSLIDSAPTALNTLKELADALNNDANYATTIQNQLATKRNISDSYNKTEVDALVNAPQNIVYTSSLWFQDVNSLGVDTLSIKGGNYITIIDALNNSLMDLDTTEIQIHPPLHCLSTATFDSNITAPNIYTRTETNTLLNGKVNTTDFNNLSSSVSANSLDISALDLTVSSGFLARYTKTESDNRYYTQTETDTLLSNKQNTLVDRGGTGAVLIDLGTDNKVSRVFGANGINVSRYLNLADTNDPNNFNMQIDGSTLETAINTNTASINTLSSSKLNVNNPVTNGSLSIQGADFKLFASGRANGNTHQGRALVHASNDVLSLNFAGDFTGGVKIYGACEFTGNVTVPNIYNKAEVDGLLSPISSSVSVNSFDITILDATVSSGFLARYTKTESDNRYYAKTDNIFEVQKIRAMSANFPNIADAVFFYDGIMDVKFDLIAPNLKSGDARFYQHDGGIYTAMHLVHPFGINMAVSSNENPTQSEILLSMEASSGVTVNTTLDVANNLVVGGNLTVAGTVTKQAIAFDCYNSSNSGDFTASDIIVPLDTARYNSGQFSISGGEITVNTNITANVIFRVSTDVVSGLGRDASKAYLQVNKGSGYLTEAGTEIFLYNRTSGVGENTASCSVILQLQSGDKLKVIASSIFGPDPLRCIAQGCGMSIVAL